MIYDEGGVVVASFDLEDLLSREEIAKVVIQPDGSRNWLMGARVELSDRNDRVLVTLSWGKVVAVDLATGQIDPTPTR